jgi:hypothetical protein
VDVPAATGPGALLASLLPAQIRYLDAPRAACLWLADVGQALLALARPVPVPEAK